MKFIWLIRHGQSLANIDEPTQNCADFSLTELGKQQAQKLSEDLPCKPERIIISPFLRAQQTAAPTLAKFPDVPVETWDDVREFTYLSQKHCAGTTRSQRLPMVTEYWQQLNPDYRDGEDTESFRMFIARVEQVLAKLRQLPDEDIFIFTHGQFLNGLLEVARHPQETIAERMEKFRQLPDIYNCEIINLILQ